MDKAELKPLVEALIFASDIPLTVDKIKQILESVSKKEIQESILELQNDCETHNRGFQLKEVANGLQFRTKPAHAPWLKKLKKVKSLRLTQPTLETLAIIAYKQPITRLEIEKIRGVDSDGVIKTLLERKLVYIAGRKDIPGKPFLFATTKTFLEVFSLENLSSLPSIKEIQDLDTAQLPSMLRDKIYPEADEYESAYSLLENSNEQIEGEGIPDNVSIDSSQASPCDEPATSIVPEDSEAAD